MLPSNDTPAHQTGESPLLLTPNSATEDSAPYEPSEHRNMAHPLTYTDSLVHIVKGALGTGVLTMPHAFKHSGYMLGFLGTLVIGAFTTSCIHILVRAQYELCRRKKIPSMTYPQILGAAFSEGPLRLRWLTPYGEVVSFLALVIDEIGALCIYVLFISSNLRQVFSPAYHVRFYLLCLFPPALFISWVPHLKYIVPLSSAATGVMLASLAISLRYILLDFPSLSERTPVGQFSDWPLFVGVTLFSLSSIGVTMPVENQMRDPRQLTSKLGVFNVASAITSIIFALFGLVGYLKYGDRTRDSITFNLPVHDALAQGINLLLSFSILCSFALPHYIVHDVVWNRFLKQKVTFKSSRMYFLMEYVSRTSIVFITFAFALLIPNLELFVSLIGAICQGSMCMGIPAIVDLLTFWYSHRGLARVWHLLQNGFILVVTCFITSTSLYFSFQKVLCDDVG